MRNSTINTAVFAFLTTRGGRFRARVGCVCGTCEPDVKPQLCTRETTQGASIPRSGESESWTDLSAGLGSGVRGAAAGSAARVAFAAFPRGFFTDAFFFRRLSNSSSLELKSSSIHRGETDEQLVKPSKQQLWYRKSTFAAQPRRSLLPAFEQSKETVTIVESDQNARGIRKGSTRADVASSSAIFRAPKILW